MINELNAVFKSLNLESEVSANLPACKRKMFIDQSEAKTFGPGLKDFLDVKKQVL